MLVRWKTFIFSVLNLLRKVCTRFHQNGQSFIEDVMKNSLISVFPETLYIRYKLYTCILFVLLNMHLYVYCIL